MSFEEKLYSDLKQGETMVIISRCNGRYAFDIPQEKLSGEDYTSEARALEAAESLLEQR